MSNVPYIVADLEWNGAYNQKTHGYFNEIIEIGAVKLIEIDDSMEIVDHFHAVIKPVVSTKLSSIVKDLTNITAEELEEGMSFPEAVSLLKEWIGEVPSVLMTWSTTDLMVLMENCRYFFHAEQIPFMERYADLQAYCQFRTGVGSKQQMGLGKACEILQISHDDLDSHRALDDSIMTANVFQKVFEKTSFKSYVLEATPSFYERMNFKTTIISDIQSPLIKRSELRFRCENCGHNLRRKGEWKFRGRAFCSEFLCRHCNMTYIGRIQFKQKYEGIEVKRRLVVKPASAAPTTDNVTLGSDTNIVE